MAAMEVETNLVAKKVITSMEMRSPGKVRAGDGLRGYYMQHINDLMLQVNQKSDNLGRLKAQRNDLNSKGLFFFYDLASLVKCVSLEFGLWMDKKKSIFGFKSLNLSLSSKF